MTLAPGDNFKILLHTKLTSFCSKLERS